VIMTVANLVAPDNVYGKGSFGLGHASVSRGHSGSSFGRSSFSRSGTSGFSAASRTSTAKGSFGRPAVTSEPPSEPITGGGFRGGFQRGEPTDIFGNSYRSRTFFYTYRTGIHTRGGDGMDAPQAAPTEQKARFVADDDMLVMDNGDVV